MLTWTKLIPDASVSILEWTTIQQRIDTLLGGDPRAIRWHELNRLFVFKEMYGANAAIVHVRAVLDDHVAPSDVTTALGQTGSIIWEYRKDNGKPAVITAWYLND